jgi:hypothetical protein
VNESRRFHWPALLALPLAALFAAASLGNILLPDAYAREAPLWAAQGLGQDWVDLLLVAPALGAAGLLARRGSRGAALVLGGLLAYTAYSLVLYAFAVHFNRLFLVYALGLGLSFYALVALVSSFGREDVASWFSPRSPARSAGLLCTVIGCAYSAMWLSEIVPAIAANRPPPSAVDVGLITNPVQVLDLGIVLPAFIIGGVGLVRRTALGSWLGPMMLGFGVVMDIALVGMTLSMGARGIPDAMQRLPVFAVMGIVTLAALVALLRRLEPSGTTR